MSCKFAYYRVVDMDNKRFNTRLNIMKTTSISSFANVKGGFNHNLKDVYFIRCIGYNSQYIEDIETMDNMLRKNEGNGLGKYIRFNAMPKLKDFNLIEFYSHSYQDWNLNNKKDITTKYLQSNSEIKQQMIDTLLVMERLFQENANCYNESIEKNFLIKLIFWLDEIVGSWLVTWNQKESYKVVYNGEVKQQEFLFFYMLTFLGFDVMLMNPLGEFTVNPKLLALTDCIEFDQKGNMDVPIYTKNCSNTAINTTNTLIGAENTCEESVHTQMSVTTITSNSLRHPNRVPKQAPLTTKTSPKQAQNDVVKQEVRPKQREKENQELKFEELALLASSVVLIAVHDKKGDVFATGSGIVINEKGYILTNNHVIRGGSYYSIRIEEDEEIYQTNEIIKYNDVLDLALFRINRTCKPLRLYHSANELVRGQKVVAIGSPLGLFNSVSDGIISGFRKIDNVDMIQFTAPISHGSSGGAVLNMYGELIGISTAGFDSGQNINLAVHYKWIHNFVRGFI